MATKGLTKDEIAFLRRILQKQDKNEMLDEQSIKTARQIIRNVQKGSVSTAHITADKVDIKKTIIKDRRKKKHDEKFKEIKAKKETTQKKKRKPLTPLQKAKRRAKMLNKQIREKIRADENAKDDTSFTKKLHRFENATRRNRFIERLEDGMSEWKLAYSAEIAEALDKMDDGRIYRTMKKLGLRSAYYDSEFFGFPDTAKAYEIYATILQDAGMQPKTQEEIEEMEKTATSWKTAYASSDSATRDAELEAEIKEMLKKQQRG